MRNITDDIKFIGVISEETTFFEGQYNVEGMTFNSYFINDEKIAILDTTDSVAIDEWLGNVVNVLNGRRPDFLIISHVEPDHSAGIFEFIKRYPDTCVVASAKAFELISQFYDAPIKNKFIATDGASLCLGKHTLSFISAPMVHWPEVIMTYDAFDKILFSADGFGKFGSDIEGDWACEARRYYFNIVGKYGAQVQSVLKKASALDIQTICPLHGPILSENLGYYLDKYNTWSSYMPEDEGVAIACASIYGNTLQACKIAKEYLEGKGIKVALFDLTREDIPEAVEDAFRYDKLIVASVTYDGAIFPAAEYFLNKLKAKNFQNRTVALIENGSWMASSGKLMRERFEAMKNIDLKGLVSIKSSPRDKVDEIKALCDSLLS